MEWKDFLNPRSMLTPGIAGSVVMLIANTLWVEFSMPQKWSALILSFLLIIPILVQFAATFVENIIYFIFNGLIVFALAVNTNFAGRKIQELTEGRTQTRPEIALNANVIKNSLALVENDQNRQLLKNNMKMMLADVTTTTAQKKDDTADVDKQDKEQEKKQKRNKRKDDREFFDKWF